MAKAQFTCPHCNQQVKVIPLAAASRSAFESLVSSGRMSLDPPAGRLRSLFWFLRGGIHNAMEEPERELITIRVEQITDDGRHWLLDELDERISLDELTRVASLIIEDGLVWSRPNLTKYAGVSQSKFHLITDEFRRLNFLVVTKANRSVLSLRAFAFLRQVLRISAGSK